MKGSLLCILHLVCLMLCDVTHEWVLMISSCMPRVSRLAEGNGPICVIPEMCHLAQMRCGLVPADMHGSGGGPERGAPASTGIAALLCGQHLELS